MKLAALALLLLAACSVSAAPPGAARVRYTVGFAKGADAAALAKVVKAYKERLEKTAGGASLRIEADAIVVEMSFDSAFHEVKPAAKLAEDLAGEAHALAFHTEGNVPLRGVAHVDDEWLRYDESGGERGLFGTQVAAHAAGAKLEVFEGDDVRMLLSMQGELEFLQAPEKQPEGERARFDTWRAAHPEARLVEYDSVAREQGGPPEGCVWRRHRASKEYVLLERPKQAHFRFGGSSLQSTGFSSDDLGYPAVSFEMTMERMLDFRAWTGKIVGRGLAIVLDDEVVTLATVNGALPGRGIITGGVNGFTPGEVQALVRLLRLPRLPLPPRSVALEFLR